jgi:uncharacterized protein (TIGR03435 family)
MNRPQLAVLLTISVRVGAYGQSAAADSSFDVVSIRPSEPPKGNGMRVGARGGPGTPDPIRFTCENCSLSNLVTQAYTIRSYQLSGPRWLNTERFDIVAKIPEGATREQFRLMQQNLLVERFKLAVHQEQKEMSIFELVVAKNGPKMKESEPDTPTNASPNGNGPESSARPPVGPPRVTTDKDGFPIFPPGVGPIVMVVNGRARIRGNNESMEHFAGILSNRLGKPVIDGTGLKGKYEFTLSWETDSLAMQRTLPPFLDGQPVPGSGDGDSGPTIFSALQQQLGLKLIQKQGPVAVLVVDHIEKMPTEN